MSYLAAAYAVFWFVTFAFVFRLSARLARLERQLSAMQMSGKEQTSEE